MYFLHVLQLNHQPSVYPRYKQWPKNLLPQNIWTSITNVIIFSSIVATISKRQSYANSINTHNYVNCNHSVRRVFLVYLLADQLNRSTRGFLDGWTVYKNTPNWHNCFKCINSRAVTFIMRAGCVCVYRAVRGSVGHSDRGTWCTATGLDVNKDAQTFRTGL